MTRSASLATATTGATWPGIERAGLVGESIPCPLADHFAEPHHEAAYSRRTAQIVCDICAETVSARLAVAIIDREAELWHARHDDAYRDDNSARFAAIQQAIGRLSRGRVPARDLAELLVLIADCRPAVPAGLLIDWCRP